MKCFSFEFMKIFKIYSNISKIIKYNIKYFIIEYNINNIFIKIVIIISIFSIIIYLEFRTQFFPLFFEENTEKAVIKIIF